jgi:hypothetical protein
MAITKQRRGKKGIRSYESIRKNRELLEAVFLYDPRRRYIDKIAEIICS